MYGVPYDLLAGYLPAYPQPVGAHPPARVIQPAPAGDPRPWQAWLVIVGIGVDLTDISRLEAALRRTHALAARLFTKSELGAPAASMAGSIAAKEAAAKEAAARAPGGPRRPDGGPRRPDGGPRRPDGGLCVAMVVARG